MFLLVKMLDTVTKMVMPTYFLETMQVAIVKQDATIFSLEIMPAIMPILMKISLSEIMLVLATRVAERMLCLAFGPEKETNQAKTTYSWVMEQVCLAMVVIVCWIL